jgi:hypothetical protein
MSTVLARRVASTPVRTAVETWARIVEIIAPDPVSPARKELAKVAGTACTSIASEAPKQAPIMIWGGGPRVRVYCVFDEDAITQDGINEDALPKSPAEGDWRMSIPFLAPMPGAMLNTFGAVQTYEHVTVDGSGQYRPAALLRPNV